MKLIDEFLVFSDHHAHPFPFGAEQMAVGGVYYNSRLVYAHQTLLEILNYAKAHSLGRIVFCGDLFHSRSAIPVDALYLMSQFFNEVYRSPIDFIILAGNHDYGDRAGIIHSLAGFDKVATVVDWDCAASVFLCGPYDMAFVPYTDDKAKAVAQLKSLSDQAETTGVPTILFAHLGIQGAEVGSDYVLVSDQDVGVQDIPWQNFAGCYFGHYHKHQQVFANGWYAGASHAHNWGDVNQKRGFLHVKLWEDAGKFSTTFDFIETTAAPRFIQVKEADLATTVIRPHDFVKVLTQRTVSDTEIATLRKTCKNLEVIPLPPDVTTSAISLSEEHLNPSAMVDAWVEANKDWLKANLPEIDAEDLVAYGHSVLTTIMKGTP